MDGLANARATFSADDISEGEVVLLTHFLELLVAFIGPSMTLKFLITHELQPALAGDTALEGFVPPPMSSKAVTYCHSPHRPK